MTTVFVYYIKKNTFKFSNMWEYVLIILLNFNILDYEQNGNNFFFSDMCFLILLLRTLF